ncbi:hypothetical protein HID58_066267, partial [Brassica napus]
MDARVRASSMAAAAARWNHRMIVAASPSSAAFTGALGLAVSSVEVVARAENVESRELFFIQRPSIRAGPFGDRGSGPWASERAS